MERYGASPEDWLHFDIILGLTADLLPVVSNLSTTQAGQAQAAPSLGGKTGVLQQANSFAA